MDPVLIIGGGLVGLTLAQALKKKDIPFEVYERDASPAARDQGWAITLHWGLDPLRKTIPSEILSLIEAEQVDPDVAKNDNGNFLFLDLATGEAKFKVPPTHRWRVNRDGMRRALLTGLEERVHWGKRLVGVEESGSAVTVRFEDGTHASGKMVIGAEGSRSEVRRALCPGGYRNEPLEAVRFVGVAVDMAPEAIAPLRALDPLLFQGCHPLTGTFMWFSVLETPVRNGTLGTAGEKFRAQICLSWRARSVEDEVEGTSEGRLAGMKRRAEGFAPCFYDAVQGIPEGTPVTEVKLADWECLEWDNKGRMTLVGDAAHAMTMYRGEAGNHGLLDAYWLAKAIDKVYRGEDSKTALDVYEGEMRERAQRAVKLSRQACYDAHEWEQLNEHSPVLQKRSLI
ncbi:putative monooxygenase [Aspergillus campestris IBT 28561]|uniref:Monooxygenase n=1 Tax=Aspergillus campestris (strain IBT 28561) TaxID=1392248 RepID=A0A2I1CRA7_ASPC2|nr:putative monooxygenase [Aspergillus campestris IBT 28561]PKY00139.1 putative monooxygenase [Aspergillus campestris IBT 28561]